ncbi:hypothetical protein [Streptomyces pseudovenezuelae]|uniref:hypothetical protein n=1 Tax=Streptomyces pseudovenezuelae TaxID=67350 RepID=UPI002E3141FE|nr:hypothetical protein [Streptomyces pseudovenezuelae]
MVIRSIRVAKVAEISVKSPTAYWDMSSECPPTTARWLTPLAASNRAACGVDRTSGVARRGEAW